MVMVGAESVAGWEVDAVVARGGGGWGWQATRKTGSVAKSDRRRSDRRFMPVSLTDFGGGTRRSLTLVLVGRSPVRSRGCATHGQDARATLNQPRVGRPC